MARATNPFADEPTGKVERGRGGFYRGANDVPYVSDPAGGIVKSGPRKGEPKRTPYGSPSGFGKLIENSFNLQKWSERRIVLGIGTDLVLVADCAKLTTLDVDSKEYKELADRIVVAAKDAAQTMLAADRGTHTHAVLEDDDEGRDWIERAEAGELLGIPRDVQLAIVEGWRLMLQRDGIEILATEASCIDDAWRLAGTLDNVAQCHQALRFRLCTGEIRTVPAGTVLIVDKKTGPPRHGHVIQVASYAQSVPYDTEAETRGVWPYTIDQEHALIAHIDVAAAIAGAAPANLVNLVYVDLVAGRELGGATVLKAKEWNARSDLLSVGMIAAEDATTSDGAVSSLDGSPSSAAPIAAEGQPASPPSAALAAERDSTPDVAIVQPDVVDGPPTSATSQIDEASPEAESTPPEPVRTPATAPEVAPSPLREAQLERAAIDAEHVQALPGRPDEGDDLSADEYASMWDVMRTQFKALDRPALDWINSLIREARDAGVGFQAQAAHTARRSHIYRGVIALAGHEPSDDALRALCALALDSDAALFPTVTPGHALGSLDATTGARFAELVDAYITPDQETFRGSFTDDGRFVLTPLAASAA